MLWYKPPSRGVVAIMQWSIVLCIIVHNTTITITQESYARLRGYIVV